METDFPLISIALCTYNGDKYLGEQLDSILSQDYKKLEIVVFDDASSDRTWEILTTYATLHSNIRIYRNAVNVGFNKNFERAIAHCQGVWIACSDQDDIWEPRKLSVLYAARKISDLIYSDSTLINERGLSLGRRISDHYRMYSGNDPKAFALQNCVSGHATLVRRSLALKASPIPEGIYYDWWLAFVAASEGGINYVDEPLVRFRQHTTNASAFTGRRKKPSAAERYPGEINALSKLALYQSQHQAFFEELLRLWTQRRVKWINPELVLLLLKNRQAVFALKKTPGWIKFRHVFKYIWGHFRALS